MPEYFIALRSLIGFSLEFFLIAKLPFDNDKMKTKNAIIHSSNLPQVHTMTLVHFD